jgi:hypothetical protein
MSNEFSIRQHLDIFANEVYAAGMQMGVLESFLDSHIRDQNHFTGAPFLETCRRRQRNEEVTFWNNAFGDGHCHSYCNDGTGEHKYWNSSAASYHLYYGTGRNSDTWNLCLRHS